MNDEERALLVDNDEGLYYAQQRSGLSMRKFVRQNRELINQVAQGRKPAHLTYEVRCDREITAALHRGLITTGQAERLRVATG